MCVRKNFTHHHDTGPIFLNDENAGKMLLYFLLLHFEKTCARPFPFLERTKQLIAYHTP